MRSACPASGSRSGDVITRSGLEGRDAGGARQRLQRQRAAARRGAVAGRLERLAQRAGNEAADATGIAEAHLGLARVHVDVDLARGKRHVEREQRVARLGQQIAVGRAHGADQQLVLHRAAVDEQVLLAGIGPVQGGQAGKPRHAHALALDVDGQRIVEEIAAHDAPEPGEMAVGPQRLRHELEAGALARRQREADAGVGHGEALHHLRDRHVLGPLGFQELEPRRRRREQLAHLHCRCRG